MQQDLLGLTRKTLASIFGDRGISAAHADTIFRNVYKNFDFDLAAYTTLPNRLKELIADKFNLELPLVTKTHSSTYDGSTKMLLTLGDGERIETVVMPESRRITACVSSQVGCRQGCVFCHTARMGLKRNLTAAEIVAQILFANRWIKENPDALSHFFPNHPQPYISNVVFMGMGEPLDNVDAIIEALGIITDDLGLRIPIRRISVSTSGHVEGLLALHHARPDIRFAISLHGTSDSERSRIMPINRKWPLSELFNALRYINEDQDHHLLIQYTLIKGLNDSPEHARRLAELLQGLRVKINLIPFNEFGQSRFAAPDADVVTTFRDILHHSDFRVMVRYSKGQDISAACGLLYHQSESEADTTQF